MPTLAAALLVHALPVQTVRLAHLVHLRVQRVTVEKRILGQAIRLVHQIVLGMEPMLPHGTQPHGAIHQPRIA
jgi:hypothetical protein